jgi:hypothetical protein
MHGDQRQLPSKPWWRRCKGTLSHVKKCSFCRANYHQLRPNCGVLAIKIIILVLYKILFSGSGISGWPLPFCVLALVRNTDLFFFIICSSHVFFFFF